MRPFNHESCALTTELSLLPHEQWHVCVQSVLCQQLKHEQWHVCVQSVLCYLSGVTDPTGLPCITIPVATSASVMLKLLSTWLVK